MKAFLALTSGLVFGIGLIVAGMANPTKVQGFLDLFDKWDPSLAFVMGGAIAVGAIGFALARRRHSAIFGGPMQIPAETVIDKRLMLGGVAFGIGWGVSGFCPGPAFVALGAGEWKAVVFVAAMIAGMAAFELLNNRGREEA